MSDTKTYTISNINDKPGLVVKGDDAEQMSNDIKAIMPVFRDFEKQFNVTPAGHPLKSQTPYQGAPVEEKPTNVQANCTTCQAEMKFQKGITKAGKNKGKPWEALFCPNQVEGDYETHKAIFL